jgi:hypothetical protein
MANPNIVNVTSIYAKTVGQAVTTINTAIVTNQANSGTIVKLNTLLASNIDGTNDADVTATIKIGGTEYNIASTVTVPADATVILISKDTGLYMEEDTELSLQASANGDLKAVCSYEIIS